MIEDNQQSLKIDVFQNCRSLPIPSLQVGTIDIQLDSFNTKKNERIVLYFECNIEGLLTFTFSLPNIYQHNSYEWKLQLDSNAKVNFIEEYEQLKLKKLNKQLNNNDE